MFGHTISYVSGQGVEFGAQLLGALFFWFPRSVWVEKPIGSGDFIAYEHIATFATVDFANFSMPLVAEAYLNFGLLGVCLSFFLLGWFCGKEDATFHTTNKLEVNDKISNMSEPLWMWRYGCALGIFLFICRGDLQSGMSFMTGIFLALTCAWLMFHGWSPRLNEHSRQLT